MPRSLLWLSLGAFALGTEGFMIAGLLPDLARDLGISLSLAGHLITIFSLFYAVGAPLMAVLTGGLERKRLLMIAIGAFGLANLLAAIAPDYTTLMVARVLLAITAATYMPAASAYAAAAAEPERRGRAIAMIYTGQTVALVIGAPLGTMIGDALSWHITFFGVAGIAAVSLLGIAAALPRMPAGTVATMAERLQVASHPKVLIALVQTVMAMTGAFAIYTYLSPYLARSVGFEANAVAGVLLVFGLASAAGINLGGYAADKWSIHRFQLLAFLVMAASFVTMALSAELLTHAQAIAPVLVAVVLWGVGGWGFAGAQQTRLVRIEPRFAPVALSLNSSAVYLGSALGAAVGSVVMTQGSVVDLGWAAAGVEIVGAALLIVSRRPAPVVQPASQGGN